MSTFAPDQWQALSPYLDEALGMAHEQRSIWLSSLRNQHPDLAFQLERLLGEHHALAEEGFLEGRSVELPTSTTLAGQTVGVYKLISQIGQGGMGSVWLAERNDGRFERRVAVKFLNIALMGRVGEERFKREGRILGLLVHPHIAKLIDAGVSKAGQPYLVLEHVDGDQVDRYCDAHRLDIRLRIRLFLDVLQAVAQAHANLVVHRDLKPSNVLVGSDKQVKLLDFGIAMLLESEGHLGEATQLTAEGGRPMTPEYAAPEQLKGESVTTATDIYALGVLLYVMLTGHHPAGGGRHTAADLIKSIVDTEPARPSDTVGPIRVNGEIQVRNAASRSTSPERLRRSLRGDLDTIVLTALKKNPGERYLSVTALADDLRRYLRSEPINARPDTLAYRAVKFVHRNRSAVALATVAAVAIVAGVMGVLIQARAARTQRDLALRQLTRAERITDLNELLLTDVAPMGKPIAVNQLLEREELIVEREHYDNTANHVELLLSIGDQYSGEDENAKALRILQQAYQLSRGLKEPSIRARASCVLSGAMVPIGELAKAESLFQEGLHELTSEPQFASDRAFCLLRGSEAAYHNGDSRNAIVRGEAAERILQGSPVHSDLQQLDVLVNLAGVYGDAGQFRESNASFERASLLMTSLGYDETQKAVKLFNDWALTLTYAGRELEAEKTYRRAIEISRTDDTDSAVLPVLLYNYGGVLHDLGRLAEASDYAERASAKARHAGDQILVLQTDLLRARIYRDRHDFARAGLIQKQLESNLRRRLPPGHYAFAVLTSDESRLAQAKGDLSSALPLANQAVSMAEAAIKNKGQCATILPALLVRRSAVELQIGQTDRAVEDATTSLSLLQKSMQPGTSSSYLGRGYLALARALKAQGKDVEAAKASRLAAEQLINTLGPDHADTRSARQSAEFSTSG